MSAAPATPLIREAMPADDTAIGEVLIAAFVETYARKMPEVTVTEGRKQSLRAVAHKRSVARVWVAELEGRIVGTVSVWPVGAPGSEAWLPNAADLRHLAVAPGFHGRGISRMLMETAERFAFDSGAKAICLHVRRGAEGVARLYRDRGYVRRPDGDLDHLPEVFLEGYVLERPRP